MMTLQELHPTIQTTIKYLSNSSLSLSDLGQEYGVSKQAMHSRMQKGLEYLKSFEPENVPKKDIQVGQIKTELEKTKKLIQHLRRRLIIGSTVNFLLQSFKLRVRACFPTFKMSRLKASEKKHLLDMAEKFKHSGGTLMEFSKAIGKSSQTIAQWKKAYELHGLQGLINRTTRPKNFGNKVPSWIKQRLVTLFLRFPMWTEYQYHSFIKHDPTTHWYVSLPTIKKLKLIHQKRSKELEEKIKKRWCFAPGTDVWTVDFTSILKTHNTKLQLLTVSDARSRLLFTATLTLNPSTEQVMDVLANLFLKYGKPLMIKADNGPEFRMECQEKLRDLSVYLLNSPQYYGQFCAAHERIHRTLKTFISDFEAHKNITQLVEEVNAFLEHYNHDMPLDYLEGKTPAEIFYQNKDFVPGESEVITPYIKDGELRMKFKDRNNNPARISIPEIKN